MLLTTAPVMFFGGKGGVGKTTIAAATAVRLAAEGHRVLLVSTDPAHNLGHIWSTRLSDRPTEVEPNLTIIELDPNTTTEQHLGEVGASMRALMPERLHGEIDTHLQLARRSPGMLEAAMLERIADIVSTSQLDDAPANIIFDTAPSGHTSRLLALPELMAAYTDGLLARREAAEKFTRAARNLDLGFGNGTDTDARSERIARRDQHIRSLLYKRRRKFTALREVLTDPTACVFHIVLTAERLPVMESAELYHDITNNGIRVAGLIVNRRSPDDGGSFTAARRNVENSALQLLDDLLPHVAAIELPWLAGEIGTRDALGDIAARI